MSAVSITSGAVRIDAGPTATRMPDKPAPAEPTPVTQPATPAPTVASAETLDHALEALRRAVEPVAQDLQFSIDDESGHTVVKVVDSSTKEVIRQIPTEEVLAFGRALDRVQGLLLKLKA